MGQILDLLLAADPSKITDIPTGQIEIPRLSKQLGKPFILKFRAGTLDEMKQIGDNASGDEGEEMKWCLYELVTDPNFKSKELREKYGVKRPVDIVSKILLGGEIINVYDKIMTLSGLRGKEVDIEKLKN